MCHNMKLLPFFLSFPVIHVFENRICVALFLSVFYLQQDELASIKCRARKCLSFFSGFPLYVV